MICSANEALKRLIMGNINYCAQILAQADNSAQAREDTLKNGQKPYAVVVGCADSRVIPEVIFDAGIGDIFTVRVAGNIIDEGVLGSVKYAVEHLGTKLVLVLGHEHCGAVHEAVCGNVSSHITGRIKQAIGAETDEIAASIKNIHNSVDLLNAALSDMSDVVVKGALYCLQSGAVKFDI